MANENPRQWDPFGIGITWYFINLSCPFLVYSYTFRTSFRRVFFQGKKVGPQQQHYVCNVVPELVVIYRVPYEQIVVQPAVLGWDLPRRGEFFKAQTWVIGEFPGNYLVIPRYF